MDELTRFARTLVEQLGASSEGVHRPVTVDALRTTLLPYRTHRRALGVDSVEDYETVLLRLVSGERGYVKTAPAEAAERCREELAGSNPDLAVLDEVSDATVQITSMAAQISGDGGDRTDRVVGGDGGDGGDGGTGQVDIPKAPVKAEAPPKKPVQSARPPEPLVPKGPSASSASSVSAVACPDCHRAPPVGRQVVFCPWCGKRLIPFSCPRCRTELDSAWKHCITCGTPVKDTHNFS